jgi:hypothetical protein
VQASLAAGTAAAVKARTDERLQAFGLPPPAPAAVVPAAEAWFCRRLLAAAAAVGPAELAATLRPLPPLLPSVSGLGALLAEADAAATRLARREERLGLARAALAASNRELEAYRREKIPANFYEERHFQKMTAKEREAIIEGEKRLSERVERDRALIRDAEALPGPDAEAAALRRRLAPFLAAPEGRP